MEFRPNFFVVGCLLVFVTLSFAQQPAAVENQGLVSFPYIARITGDGVNVRSGPGTNYYACGELNKDTRVKVVGQKFSWSQIVPTSGSFSWISKQYVIIDANDSGIGIVTGDSVRVYAGSEALKPIHSTTLQSKLNKGDKVQLAGEENGNYYKIAPPQAAYLWVMTEYTEPLGTEEEVSLVVVPEQKEQDQQKVVSVVPTTFSTETQMLREYHALEEKIKAERTKPIPEQNYAEIKKALIKIAEDKESGKAARYSKFALKQVARMELALKTAEDIEVQDKQLNEVCQQIDKLYEKKFSEIQDLGRFIAVGTFKISETYGKEQHLRHWRITDESGKNICYAVPADSVSADLDEFASHKVGLVGSAAPHPQTAGALVTFTEIVKLD